MKYFDKEKGFIYPLTEERQNSINILHNYEWISAKWIHEAMLYGAEEQKALNKKMDWSLNLFNFKLHKRYLRLFKIDAYYSIIFQRIYKNIQNETAYYLLYNSIEKHKIMRGLVDD